MFTCAAPCATNARRRSSVRDRGARLIRRLYRSALPAACSAVSGSVGRGVLAPPTLLPLHRLGAHSLRDTGAGSRAGSPLRYPRPRQQMGGLLISFSSSPSAFDAVGLHVFRSWFGDAARLVLRVG